MNLATIQLLQYVGDPKTTPFAHQFSWPLTIIATGTNIDNNIFVYQLNGGEFDPAAPQGDTFSCVASTSQLNELPTSAAAAQAAGTPYYRQAVMTVICRSAREAAYVWSQVQEDTNDLIANFNSAGTLVGATSVQLDGANATSTTSSLFTLTALPAGGIARSGGTTSIVTPQMNASGWLPASVAPWTPPAGALFYYNMAMQSALGNLFPLSGTASGHLLLRDNVPMPYNTIYQIDAHTIWWNSFNPTTVANYPDTSPYPWAVDYQSPVQPGMPLNLTFVV